MNLHDEINKVKKKENNVKAKILAFLKKKEKELGTSDTYKDLGNNCFTVNSSELTKYGTWSPTYYNWRQQYNMIRDLIECTPLERIPSKIAGLEPVTHPTVFKTLKELICEKEESNAS